MATRLHLASHKRLAIPFFVDGTLSTGDGQAWIPIPVAAKATRVVWGVNSNGDTSSSTDLQLNLRRDGSAVGDLFATAPSIAHDSSTNSTVSNPDQNHTDLRQGDVVRVDIDSIPGGTSSSDLYGMLILHLIED